MAVSSFPNSFTIISFCEDNFSNGKLLLDSPLRSFLDTGKTGERGRVCVWVRERERACASVGECVWERARGSAKFFLPKKVRRRRRRRKGERSSQLTSFQVSFRWECATPRASLKLVKSSRFFVLIQNQKTKKEQFLNRLLKDDNNCEEEKT